jgi:hypothetical protein
MNMREKLARAMWERIRERDNPKIADPDYMLPPWEDETDQLRADWLDLVGVALDTLREPDEGMAKDGAAYRGCGCNDCREKAVEIWQAMIDAARSEK